MARLGVGTYEQKDHYKQGSEGRCHFGHIVFFQMVNFVKILI